MPFKNDLTMFLIIGLPIQSFVLAEICTKTLYKDIVPTPHSKPSNMKLENGNLGNNAEILKCLRKSQGKIEELN